MLRARGIFIALLALTGGLAQAQQVNLVLRQPLNLLISSSVWDDNPYEYVHINLAAECIPEDSLLAYMLNFGYRYKTEDYTNYSNLAPRGPFFRETYMIGAVARRYLGRHESSTRYFVEAGVQANFIYRNERITIGTPYRGNYQEFSTNAEMLWSGSLGLGLSKELFWKIRFEPNIQFVFASRSRERLRKELPMLLPAGSSGPLQLVREGITGQTPPANQYILLSLSLKVPLFSPSE